MCFSKDNDVLKMKHELVEKLGPRQSYFNNNNNITTTTFICIIET